MRAFDFDACRVSSKKHHTTHRNATECECKNVRENGRNVAAPCTQFIHASWSKSYVPMDLISFSLSFTLSLSLAFWQEKLLPAIIKCTLLEPFSHWQRTTLDRGLFCCTNFSIKNGEYGIARVVSHDKFILKTHLRTAHRIDFECRVQSDVIWEETKDFVSKYMKVVTFYSLPICFQYFCHKIQSPKHEHMHNLINRNDWNTK